MVGLGELDVIARTVVMFTRGVVGVFGLLRLAVFGVGGSGPRGWIFAHSLVLLD